MRSFLSGQPLLFAAKSQQNRRIPWLPGVVQPTSFETLSARKTEPPISPSCWLFLKRRACTQLVKVRQTHFQVSAQVPFDPSWGAKGKQAKRQKGKKAKRKVEYNLVISLVSWGRFISFGFPWVPFRFPVRCIEAGARRAPPLGPTASCATAPRSAAPRRPGGWGSPPVRIPSRLAPWVHLRLLLFLGSSHQKK